MTKTRGRLPKVVLVGRMNVGKSTIFNRLISSNKSLTFDYPGVTRDFISEITSWQDCQFELIDSGGVSFAKNANDIAKRVQATVFKLIEQADLVLLVCDGAQGLTDEDRQIALHLRQLNKLVIVVVNKSDVKVTADNQYEFQSLGFTTYLISALHSYAIGDLLDGIVAALADFKSVSIVGPDKNYSVAFLGKPNVGKSSLLNLLVKAERAIVAPEAGTTREAIATKIEFSQATIELTDTPGVRRIKAVRGETLEELMVKTSFRAVKHADIILLLIDTTEPISDQELKLAFYVFEQFKALIVIFNKHDLATPETQMLLTARLEKYAYFFKKIELLTISCQSSKNVGKVLPLVHQIWERANQQLGDLRLNELLRGALQRKPLYHKTNLLKLYNVKQVGVAPITLVLFVNQAAWFTSSQLAFFENLLRDNYQLKSVPIKFIVRQTM